MTHEPPKDIEVSVVLEGVVKEDLVDTESFEQAAARIVEDALAIACYDAKITQIHVLL